MRRWVFMVVSGCANPPAAPPPCGDATHTCVTWHWSFSQDGNAVPCPAEVTSVEAYAEQWTQLEAGPPHISTSGSGSFDCAAGEGTFLSTVANREYLVVHGASHDLIKIEELHALKGLDQIDLEGDISLPRGYVRIEWQLFSKELNRSVTCAEAMQRGLVSLELSAGGVATFLSCDALTGTTPGLDPGSYKVTLEALDLDRNSQATADAPMATLTDGETDVGSVTLMLP